MAEDNLMNTDPCLYVIYMSYFSYEKAMDIYCCLMEDCEENQR